MTTIDLIDGGFELTTPMGNKKVFCCDIRVQCCFYAGDETRGWIKFVTDDGSTGEIHVGDDVVGIDTSTATALADAAMDIQMSCKSGDGAGMVDGEINADSQVICLTGSKTKYKSVGDGAPKTNEWIANYEDVVGKTSIEINGVVCDLDFPVTSDPIIDISAIETALIDKGFFATALEDSGSNVKLILDGDLESLECFTGVFENQIEVTEETCYFTPVYEKAADGTITLTSVLTGAGSMPARANDDGTITIDGIVYGECKPEEGIKDRFTDPERVCAYLKEDKDLSGEFIVLTRMYDCEAKKWVEFEEGVECTEENIFNNQNYNIVGSEKLSGLPIIKSELKTKKGKSIDVCGGPDGKKVTIADLAPKTDAEILDITAKIPPLDGYEWKLLGLYVNQHPAKKILHCDLSEEDGDVNMNTQIPYAYGSDTGQYITVSETPDYIGDILPEADSCGCLPNQDCLVDDTKLTVPFTLAPFTAIEYCPVYVCAKISEGKKKEIEGE